MAGIRGAGELAHALDTHDERAAAIHRVLDHYLRTVHAVAQHLYPHIVRLSLPAVEADPAVTLVPLRDDRAASIWVDTERPNLVAAIVHATRHGPRPAAWLLADALRGYFYLRMHTLDWLTTAECALTAARADADPRAQAAAHLSLGNLYWRQSDYRQAIAHCSRAVALCRRTGWLDGQAAALGNLGHACWQSGRLRQAARHYALALASLCSCTAARRMSKTYARKSRRCWPRWGCGCRPRRPAWCT